MGNPPGWGFMIATAGNHKAFILSDCLSSEGRSDGDPKSSAAGRVKAAKRASWSAAALAVTRLERDDTQIV